MKKKSGYLRYAPIACAVSASLLLTACGGSSSTSSSGGNNNLVASNRVVSIDAMTSVPVINGSATRGTLYIHNYNSKPATGLSFGVGNGSNAAASSKLAGLLSKIGMKSAKTVTASDGFTLNNPELCSSIPAGGSCAINFTTPSLIAGNLGSSLVTLSYKQDGKTLTTNQVVNYHYLPLSASKGVNFTGSLTVAGKQGQTRHVVGYLYGGGNAGTVYSNVKLNATSPATSISGGFINSQQVAAGQVIAVEYAVALQNDKPSYVNVTPTWGSSATAKSANYSLKADGGSGSGNNLGLSLNPLADTVSLIFGNIPVLTAPTSSAAVINVVNNGNAEANGPITAVATGGQASALTIDDSACRGALPADAETSCSISFSVAGYTPGSTTVEFFNAGTKVGEQSVMWTNATPIPAVKTVPSTTTVEAAAPSLTNALTFTLTNMGKAPLQAMTFLPSTTGNATWTPDANGGCLNAGSPVTELAPNASCTISGNLSSTNVGTGKLYYSIKGSFNSKNYSFVSPAVSYSFTGASPVLSITPASDTITLSIIGDGETTASQVFTVENTGTLAPATISALNVVDTTNPLLDPAMLPKISTSGTVTNQRCTTTTVLNSGDKCDVFVKYGPISSTTDINGTANLSVDYSGGNPSENKNAVDGFAFDVTGDANLRIGPAEANGGLTGAGTEDDHFMANASAQALIKIVYSNPSAADYTKLNINTNTLPLGVTVDVAGTNCPVGATTGTLLAGANCTLMLKVDRSTLIYSPQGGSPVLNFTKPGATWTTTDGLFKKAGTTLVYLDYTQPVVTSSLSVSSGSFETTDLTMTLSNANSGAALDVDVSAVEPWLSTEPIVSTNCTVGASYAVNCNLAVGSTASATVTYTMPDYLQPGETTDIPLGFSAPNEEFVYFNPIYTFINYEAPVAQ